jgi:hypothetical protein
MSDVVGSTCSNAAARVWDGVPHHTTTPGCGRCGGWQGGTATVCNVPTINLVNLLLKSVCVKAYKVNRLYNTRRQMI